MAEVFEPSARNALQNAECNEPVVQSRSPYDLCDRNPIQWVRQSAKRRTAPDILTSDEVRGLLANLRFRERILILLAVTTGLRRSELFALKWRDVDFQAKQIHVRRSIVQNVIGACKTETSQKPVPAHNDLVEALRKWHRQTPYRSPESWVFASPVNNQGRRPYLAQEIMRRHIRPVARELGIAKRIGWHTFRHTYSTLLQSTGAELKIMQELLRHSTIRVTLDTYTQAVTTESETRRRGWSRSCSEKKPRKRNLCLDKLYFRHLFCVLCLLCSRENGALSVSCLERMRGRRDSNSRPLP
jgi:integrase